MDIRYFFFKSRSYTPIPIIVLVLIFAETTWQSFIGGLGLVLLGEGVRFWGVAYAGAGTRTTKRASGNRLVTNGPFGYVRNPLYVGNFLLSYGLVIMSWAWMPWTAIVFFFLFGFQYGLIVHYEEEYLSQRFGSQYEEYQRNVRPWIPRLKHYTSNEPKIPNYIKALRSERNTFQFIITFCVLLMVRWHLL